MRRTARSGGQEEGRGGGWPFSYQGHDVDAVRVTPPPPLLQNMKDNPIHIINVAIRSADSEDDDLLVAAFGTFAQSKVGQGHDLLDFDELCPPKLILTIFCRKVYSLITASEG